MTRRLLVDIYHSLALQKSLRELSGLFSAIVELASRIENGDKELKRSNSAAWWQLLMTLVGTTMEYQDLKDREMWLSAMQPIFIESIVIAGNTAVQMTRVRKACDAVTHNIYTHQGTPSRSSSDWVGIQVREIGKGTDAIEEKMKDMKFSNTQFAQSLFQKVWPAA